MMEMPALIETTVQLFPHKESDAATTRTTIKGHATGRLCYSPLKSRKNLLSHILKKGLASYMSCIEILEKASEAWRLFSGCMDPFHHAPFSQRGKKS